MEFLVGTMKRVVIHIMDFEPTEDKFDDELPPPRGQRFIYRIVIVVVILGILYLYGFYQGFLFRRTGEGVEQQPVGELLAETIEVPTRVFVLVGGNNLSSKRDEGDVNRLVQNSNVVWDQAAIEIYIEQIEFVSLTDIEIRELMGAPSKGVPTRFGQYEGITVLLLKSLDGINGISYGSSGIVAVADFTTVFDFRVLAHEWGHVFGLSHVPIDRNSLMFQGANGTFLSEGEIDMARDRAKSLFEQGGDNT